jgi:branched-chain amino acid transport system substrate-binding protein
MIRDRNSISRRQLLKRAGILGAAVGTPGLLSACGVFGGDDDGGGGTDEALKIGLLVPTSGVYAALGEDMRNGFDLYLDNNNGRLGGRRVELVVEDEGETPEGALRKAQKLVRQDRVTLVTGIVSSAAALSMRDLFDEEQIPLIISNAGANDLTGAARSPYVFRTSFANSQVSLPLGGWVYDNITQSNAFVTAPDYAAGAEATGGFRETFEAAGGSIVGESFPPFGTTDDYQPFLSDIERSGAEVVFAFYAGGEAITFVTQYEQFGLKDSIPLVGSGFLTDEGVLPAQKDAALGIQTSLHYTPRLDNPTNEEFSSAYQEAFDEPPTVYAVQQYDAAQVVDRAIRELDGDTGDVAALIEALANVGTIDSPRGEFEMDPETHNPIQPMYLREVQEVGGVLVNEPVENLGRTEAPQ